MPVEIPIQEIIWLKRKSNHNWLGREYYIPLFKMLRENLWKTFLNTLPPDFRFEYHRLIPNFHVKIVESNIYTKNGREGCFPGVIRNGNQNVTMP